MEQLNLIIATNLKQIRDHKKLSLDKVASLTGVSKSMLGQIERGESNPTITTVWKIANGLKVSFSSLINEPQTDNKIVRRLDLEPMVEDKGKLVLYPMFPYGEIQPFEVYMVDLEKGAYYEGNTHGEGTFEILTVSLGEVTLRVDEEDIFLKEGDGIRFRAHKAHSYHNTNDGLSRINITIYYNER